jgi:hypothetical protein
MSGRRGKRRVIIVRAGGADDRRTLSPVKDLGELHHERMQRIVTAAFAAPTLTVTDGAGGEHPASRSAG